jgi:molybdopterin-binding protein
MALSARNQLKGRIKKITLGDIMAHVVVEIGKHTIESVITRQSAEDQVVSGPAAPGTGPHRAGRAGGDSESASPGSNPSRHRGDVEQPRAPHAPRYRMAAGIGGQSDKTERPTGARENRLKSVRIRNAGRGWFRSNWQKRTQQEVHKTQYQRPDQGRKKTVDLEARYDSGRQ